MGETIRASHRGKAVGTVQGGWAVGWGLAAACYTVVFMIFPPETAWRSMFWIGILPALLIFFIRRHVKEPEVYTRCALQSASSRETSSVVRGKATAQGEGA
jgi:MFS family permease